MAAQVRSPAPEFALDGVLGDSVSRYELASYKGKWVILAFYPKDMTAVCGSELPVFSSLAGELEKRGAVLLAASTQDVDSKKKWIAEGLGNLQIPLLADVGGKVADAYGVYLADGLSLRATFIINPEGVLRWISVHDRQIGRSTEEIVRVLDALQTGTTCAVNWQKA
jgi:peroxiredoxin (alkyl hydroperoxide reductase subunit C)